MKVTGQLLGSAAIREGYRNDSNGNHIHPDRIYVYEGEKYQALTALWMLGEKRPKVLKPLTNVNR